MRVGKLLQPAARRGAVQRLLLFDVRRDLGQLHLVGDEIAVTAELVVQGDELAHLQHVLLVQFVVQLHDLTEHGQQSGVALDVLAIHGGDFTQDRDALLILLVR